MLALFAALLVVASSGLDSADAETPLTRPPTLLGFVEAPYPEAARVAGREGVVTLAIDVDELGEVTRVEIVESAGADFDMAALDAAAAFVFSPAEAGELGPVPVRILYRYAFVLGAPVEARTATVAAEIPRAAGEVYAASARFSGVVREAGTRAPVAFAKLTLASADAPTGTETSTEADARGRFVFQGLSPGRYTITISAAGFASFEVEEVFVARESVDVLYYLERVERSPYEVVVRTRLEQRVVARRTLRFEELEHLPGTQGDALRVVQNLPGVARSPFGVGLLVVRGAPPQDTGVFLDGQRLPVLFHFGGLGGLSSVINARLLESIDFLPGGFGPELGRVSAGAVELRTRSPAADRVHGEAVIDLAGASVFLEGPVSQDLEDGRFMLALRRSYIDGVLAAVLSLANSTTALAPRSYDYQALYERSLGDPRVKLVVLAYGSDDELVYLGSSSGAAGVLDSTQARVHFHRVNPRLTYVSGDETFSLSPLIGVDYSNLETAVDGSGGNVRFELRDFNAGVRIDASTRPAAFLKLFVGGDLLYSPFSADSQVSAFPRIKDFPGPVPTDTPTRKDFTSIDATLASIYVDGLLTPFEGLSLSTGIRLDHYAFSARSQPGIDPRLVAGRALMGLDPRISGRYRLFDGLAAKAQFGLFGQPPSPPQLYLNADLPLQRARQASCGFEWVALDRLTLDAQVFSRRVFNRARSTSDVELGADGVVRPIGFLADGEMRSRGIELLLRLEKRRGLFGWMAYTLSRSEERRGQGAWRPDYFVDQTHNLNVVLSYELGLNWVVSGRFRYVTGGGLPTTAKRWFDADGDAYDRTLARELRRAPAFHQLDLRIDKRWLFNEWILEVYLDVLNVYDRKNTEIYAPTFDYKGEVAIPSLPILPVFGLKGSF